MNGPTYDYIVIGAGTSGCVVASRLSENPEVKVLLMEAGDKDKDSTFHNPDLLSFFSTWQTDAVWQYTTEEEKYLGGRKVPIVQGKVLGGGSAVNGMIHVRGSKHDYNYWNYLGNEGWGYDQVLPYFKKLEDYEGGESEFHGVGGPINVVKHKNLSPVAHSFIEAAVELGYHAGPNVTTEQELRDHIRDFCFTEWHPTSTCKMGRDHMAVVDPQLRVYGVEGLRVVDASIMPAITSGNLNAPCLMIGEKASDMIINGY